MVTMWRSSNLILWHNDLYMCSRQSVCFTSQANLRRILCLFSEQLLHKPDWTALSVFLCRVVFVSSWSSRCWTLDTQVWSEVNQAVLDYENRESTPKLAKLLKLLLWAQNELDQKKVKYPKMTDLSTGTIEDPKWTSTSPIPLIYDQSVTVWQPGDIYV